MEKTIIVHEDAVVITTTGGKVFYENTEPITDPVAVRLNIKQDQYKAMRADYLARITAVETELTNWPTYTAAQVKDSLQNVIIPALRRTMRVSAWIVDYIFNIESEVGPS